MSSWTGFEILTQGDFVLPIADPGYGLAATRDDYDGLGTYISLSGDTMSVFVNHETSTAAISRVDVNRGQLQTAIASLLDGGTTTFPKSFVTGIGYAYDTIFDGGYHAITAPDPVAVGTAAVGIYGNTNFDRFCSGTLHRANAFGLRNGFVDPIYLTGEEVAGGLFYALDPRSATLWEAPDLGMGRWENAASVDTGTSTHVALVTMSDNGTSPGDYISMYVGEKGIDVNLDGEIDFLERNGLRGGTNYFFIPEAGASTTDLPDGSVAGTWSTSIAGALRETKLEDISTNPFDGSQAVFADSSDGVYIMDLDLKLTPQGLDTSASTVNITQIDDDNTSIIGEPDNLDWSENGQIFIQEDGDGDGMFSMNSSGGGIVQIAAAFSEPSGIVDVSAWVGYEPGSVLLSSLQGAAGRPAQLTLLASPDAAQVAAADFDGNGDYACSDIDGLVAAIVAETHDPTYDLSADGIVDAIDLALWLAEAGAAELPLGIAYALGDANLDGEVDELDFSIWDDHKFTTTGAWCDGDFNADGVVNGRDFLLWNENKHIIALAVPEIIANQLAGVVALLMLWRQRGKWTALPTDLGRTVPAAMAKMTVSGRLIQHFARAGTRLGLTANRLRL